MRVMWCAVSVATRTRSPSEQALVYNAHLCRTFATHPTGDDTIAAASTNTKSTTRARSGRVPSSVGRVRFESRKLPFVQRMPQHQLLQMVHPPHPPQLSPYMMSPLEVPQTVRNPASTHGILDNGHPSSLPPPPSPPSASLFRKKHLELRSQCLAAIYEAEQSEKCYDCLSP